MNQGSLTRVCQNSWPHPGGDIPTGGMNAAAKTLGPWRCRCGPAFDGKSGHSLWQGFFRKDGMATFHLKQVGPLAVEADGGMWKLCIEAPASLGGSGTCPGPTDLLPVALAACEMMLALLTAKKLGVPLTGVEATVNKVYRSNPSRIGDMEVTLKNVFAQLDPQWHEKIKSAVDTCPVLKTLEQPPAVRTHIS